MSKVGSLAGEADEADAARTLGQPDSLIIAVRSLISFLVRRGPLDPDVEDLTQEVLRRALEGRERLAAGRAVRPWVLGIARHVAADWRRECRRAARRTESDPGPSASPPLCRVPSPEPFLDAQLADAERRRGLMEALKQLPATQRQALWLFHVEGLSYREIALRLAAPVGTVGTWIIRGRQQLADTLPPEDGP
ncbi:MAG: RNA polymerase sigma factor [Polyangiaceae bacterium]|nr:RNA polymerase sigma factor [Polyangiaceae bacterium]